MISTHAIRQRATNRKTKEQGLSATRSEIVRHLQHIGAELQTEPAHILACDLPSIRTRRVCLRVQMRSSLDVAQSKLARNNPDKTVHQ